MRILFVSGSLNRGGAERVITLLAEEYRKRGDEVHLAVLLDNKQGYKVNDTIILHDIVHRGSRLKNVSKWIGGLRNILQKVKPDVVVSFAGRINMITMLAARGLGIPVLVSERNDPANDRRNHLDRWLCKKFYQRADKVVFQTQYQMYHYKAYCSHNGVVIGNPIAAPVYEGEHSNKNIICVGKLMDQKNHPMMIRAFALIAAEFPDKKVFIYGEGEKRRELEALIQKKGMQERIQLCGNTNRIFDVMHEYQYFVMCSNYEGLSNALLEAMISGMVCITTNWNGAEEIIQDGVNGYLAPVGDANALARKLRVILHPDSRQKNLQVSKAAIETGNNFTNGNVMQQWCATIDGIVR